MSMSNSFRLFLMTQWLSQPIRLTLLRFLILTWPQPPSQPSCPPLLPGCSSACWVPTGSRQMWSFHRAPHRLTRPTTPGPATMESASLGALNFSSVYASIHQGLVRWRACGTAQCSALYHMWYTWALMCAEQCQCATTCRAPPANGGSEGEIESGAGHLDDPALLPDGHNFWHMSPNEDFRMFYGIFRNILFLAPFRLFSPTGAWFAKRPWPSKKRRKKSQQWFI